MAEIVIPEIGESISSGILTTWLKQEGDLVQEGDNLFELETDKATMEIPAISAGVLHIHIAEGTEVLVGTTVGTIDSTASATEGSKETPTAPTTISQEKPLPVKPSPQPTINEQNKKRTMSDLSPAVRRLVEELSLDPANIPSSHPSGRLTKEDVQKHIKNQTSTQSAIKKVAPPLQGTLCKEKQERVPMTTLRKRIAERLVESKQTSAHLTTFNEVDMQAVMTVRKKYKELFEKKHKVRLGFMSFFLKAAVKGLMEFPAVNAFIDGTDIIYNHFYDISVAISSDRGLITPVLRNVDTKSFAELEGSILDFAQRAKLKKIMPNELMGGTFTISNGGIFGSMLSTPIPNPPQTAILGMHSIQEKPVVRNGEIVIRPIMYLALSYDHRLLDGREAISFLKTIKEAIEDPTSILLNV